MRQRGSFLVYGIIAAFLLVGLASVMYRIHESGKDAVRLEWAEANRLIREAEAKTAHDVAQHLEIKREKARVVYRTITKEVDRVVTRDVYRNVCLDDDGLRLAHSAIRGEVPAAPQPDKPLPKPPGAPGRSSGLSLALDRGGF